MGELAILGRSGDTKVIWGRDNEAEIENARRTFQELTKKGFYAWSVKGKDGEKDRRITEFDPQAERLILIPPVVGGALELGG